MADPANLGARRRPAPAGSEARPKAAALSIRVVSRATAIEPDTLRMWERRYGFPKPDRRDGGSRVYTESDVEALLLIRRALAEGYRPGEVVHLPVRELERLISTTAPTQTALPTVDAALGALAKDDVSALRKALKSAAALLGPKKFVTEFAHPASVKVGELWADGKIEVRHEHLFTTCLSSQLHLLLSAFDDAARSPSVLLATLPEEPHGLGLEMIAVVLAASNVTPRLLGVDTPPDQIVAAARAYSSDAVGLAIMPPADMERVGAHLRWMLAELPRRVPLWAGGAGAAKLEVGLGLEGLVLVRDWAALDEAIRRLSGSRS